ncbi:large conductance mechanosensitive channel protein MscL [Pseudokineococcus sp. 1T1Z-3]|uniref:large conductance mechanosensitive channel protein MscL n=1 Tax=Pseudokineococcus sp. 1T1Z-3 TaxID=3132745 RepID=UPI0030A36D7A
MISGFKDFILRGNVIDLAVAVVVGSAFTAIVTAISTDVFGNLIAVFFEASDYTGLGVTVPSLDGEGPGTRVVFGTTVAAVINFLVVAAVLYFLVVMPMNRFFSLRKDGEKPEPAAPSEDVLLLQEIRDLLRAQQQPGATPSTTTDVPPSSH